MLTRICLILLLLAALSLLSDAELRAHGPRRPWTLTSVAGIDF